MRRVTWTNVLAIAIAVPYGLLATGVTRAIHLRLAHSTTVAVECDHGCTEPPESPPKPTHDSHPCAVCDQLVNGRQSHSGSAGDRSRFCGTGGDLDADRGRGPAPTAVAVARGTASPSLLLLSRPALPKRVTKISQVWIACARPLGVRGKALRRPSGRQARRPVARPSVAPW